MVKKYFKLLLVIGIVNIVLFAAIQNSAHVSAAIERASIMGNTTLGKIENINQIFIFAFNTLRYFGWAGVIIGIGYALFGLIYKLIGEDNEKVMMAVQGYLTRAVVILLAGVLLLSAGFVTKIVGELFGMNIPYNLKLGRSSSTGGVSPEDDVENIAPII